jgi:hypothetical protein
MTISLNSSYAIPMLSCENYHIWDVKMKFYMRSRGLCKFVISDPNQQPLRENPTIAQIKAKAITCLHSGLKYHIFIKIINLETPKHVLNKI